MKDKPTLFVLWAGGLLFALCPLIFDWTHRLFQENPPPLVSLIIHGELLIIAVAIVADTFVRAVASDDSKPVRIPLIVGCPIVLVTFGFCAGDLRGVVETTEKALAAKALAEKVLATSVTETFLASRVQIVSLVAFAISMILSLAAAMILED